MSMKFLFFKDKRWTKTEHLTPENGIDLDSRETHNELVVVGVDCKSHYAAQMSRTPEKHNSIKEKCSIRVLFGRSLHVIDIFTAMDFHIVIIVSRIKFGIASWMKMIYCVTIGSECAQNSELIGHSHGNLAENYTHVQRLCIAYPLPFNLHSQ